MINYLNGVLGTSWKHDLDDPDDPEDLDYPDDPDNTGDSFFTLFSWVCFVKAYNFLV